MKTKVEILDEMVAHFATNPRATDGLYFAYLTEDGKRCGHSIFVRDELITNNDFIGSAESLIEEHGDDIHKPEYRGHSAEFWSGVQTLHDFGSYWKQNAKGGNDLTEAGRLYLNELKTKWATNGCHPEEMPPTDPNDPIYK